MPEDGIAPVDPTMLAPSRHHSGGHECHARLDIGVAPNGWSFLRRQEVRYPYHICRPFRYQGDPPGMATIYLQSCAGGIFDGDNLTQIVSLDEGASLHITSQASTIIHETRDRGAAQATTLRAGGDSFIEYLPDPIILFPHARFSTSLTAELAPTATAVLSDSFLWHDPAEVGRSFDALSSETRISIDSLGLVALDRFEIGGADLLRRMVGINAGYRAQGSMAVITGGRSTPSLLDSLQQALASQEGAYAMASSLPYKVGYWVRLLATDAVVLRHMQQMVWRLAREALIGRAPVLRRK